MHMFYTHGITPVYATWLLGIVGIFFISLNWGHAYTRMRVIHLSEECASGHHR